ncbi:hypothetical protein [Xenorhabdus innexi]|uniref:Putative membrane protein n=1 Tax=Xenorhabdus innexi TaxID=290109 RepID=A0A1N6N0W8_9GAMM|nr:hypothetical protein [Xenorhabdus innexi]PHM26904.1 hypothetical protein Xinn_04002 [Xenorhabdus innexi]SIP74684.1 putative membrane protein [Xenorhabdus innexi]
MKFKGVLKWVIIIVTFMMGLLLIAHLSLINPDLAEGFNQLMYRWRYYSFLWRMLIYTALVIVLYHLWKVGKKSSELKMVFKRIAFMVVLFVLVSEVTIWLHNGE